MQRRSEMSVRPCETKLAELAIERLELRTVRLKLKEPFETSFGSIDSRLIFLVSVTANGKTGWGEVVASEEPHYSYETVGTATHVIRDYLAPVMMTTALTDLNDLSARLASFRGHNMAKAGLELAYLDLLGQTTGQSLSQLIGGTRSSIDVGVSLGIQASFDRLLDRINRYLSLGYQRIKLKIKPGWDIDIVRQVRRCHADIVLSVDANSAYTIADESHLKQLDEFRLLMIEQPLDHDDLVDHAKFQSQIRTALCLDESITGIKRAQQALDLRSCQIINIKIGRVGGYSAALGIHDVCHDRKTPVWCGGMLESGIGRAHNIALASLPGFSLPGDISASSRYFARDVITPEVNVSKDGTVEVPPGPGIGFEVDIDYINSMTQSIERIERANGSKR
ncbi:MAG TPA: o-succinylbenzoate synthase [Pyrinomonadaceae bacterium]|nr:o-succinylbenzoate synthase [Pyrinomonadaceae bacterium]